MSPRRKKGAEAEGYKTSQGFRLGETQKWGPTSLSPGWIAGCWVHVNRYPGPEALPGLKGHQG